MHRRLHEDVRAEREHLAEAVRSVQLELPPVIVRQQAVTVIGQADVVVVDGRPRIVLRTVAGVRLHGAFGITLQLRPGDRPVGHPLAVVRTIEVEHDRLVGALRIREVHTRGQGDRLDLAVQSGIPVVDGQRLGVADVPDVIRAVVAVEIATVRVTLDCLVLVAPVGRQLRREVRILRNSRKLAIRAGEANAKQRTHLEASAKDELILVRRLGAGDDLGQRRVLNAPAVNRARTGSIDRMAGRGRDINRTIRGAGSSRLRGTQVSQRQTCVRIELESGT